MTGPARLRHGVVLLPEHDWKDASRRWVAAERLGFDHAWTYDHLLWRALARRPWFGCLPTLAAAAAVTERIGLGTLVSTPNYRHPAVLARDLTTIDDIAGGRLVCGLGAGAPGPDATLLGGEAPAPRARADRLDEFVGLLDELLVHGDVDHNGPWYTVRGATYRPRSRSSAARIPFAIAATGPRGMRLAARHARYWVTSGAPNDFSARPWRESLPVLRAQLAQVDDACLAVGRDPASLRKLVLADAALGGITASVGSWADAAGELAELGVTDLVVHWPRPQDPFRGDERVLADFAGRHLQEA